MERILRPAQETVAPSQVKDETEYEFQRLAGQIIIEVGLTGEDEGLTVWSFGMIGTRRLINRIPVTWPDEV